MPKKCEAPGRVEAVAGAGEHFKRNVSDRLLSVNVRAWKEAPNSRRLLAWLVSIGR
jgi:hypothetical protein